jgi:hypothetical protein
MSIERLYRKLVIRNSSIDKDLKGLGDWMVIIFLVCSSYI